MKTERANQYTRLINALKWGLLGGVYIAATYEAPWVPLVGDPHPPQVEVAVILGMGALGYGVEYASQWMETPDAVGPDELDSWESINSEE